MDRTLGAANNSISTTGIVLTDKLTVRLPTSSSQLNQVERWLRDLADSNMPGGVLSSVLDVIPSIESCPDAPIPGS